ncbi:MAG: hypothetical protein ABSG91_16495 [Syntrophobacteraceae bacterium]|jgi:hypothetical protein
MITLKCGKDLERLGIRGCEGLNISPFLDHLESCDKCRKAQGELVDELNKLIGGEQE